MAESAPMAARDDLVSRSWKALGIGAGLVLVGGVVLNATYGSFQPATGSLLFGYLLTVLGGMSVQAAIVGFVFGSYDGVRPGRLAQLEHSAETSGQRRSPGWYLDPEDPSVTRWWNGWDWTETKPTAEFKGESPG